LIHDSFSVFSAIYLQSFHDIFSIIPFPASRSFRDLFPVFLRSLLGFSPILQQSFFGLPQICQRREMTEEKLLEVGGKNREKIDERWEKYRKNTKKKMVVERQGAVQRKISQLGFPMLLGFVHHPVGIQGCFLIFFKCLEPI
jgi:hypothetical protein